MIERLETIELDEATASGLALPAGAITLRRAWPRSADHLLLEFVDVEGGLVPGQWHRDQAKLRRVADATAVASPDTAATLVAAGGTTVLLQPHGADRRLPCLVRRLRAEGARLVAHRPERRAVVAEQEAGARRFARVMRPERTAAMLERARCARSLRCDALDVPEVVAADKSAGVIVLSALEGTSLHERLADPHLPGSLEAVGHALSELHESRPSRPVAAHDARREIETIHGWLGYITAFAPDEAPHLRGRANAVLETLATGSASGLSLLHRDLHDKQIIVGPEGRIGMIDFDTLATGEAALDLGNMLAHLELRVCQGRLADVVAGEAAASFIAGYGPPEPVTDRIGAYVDAARLRLACVYAFRPAWRTAARRMSDRIGSPVAV